MKKTLSIIMLIALVVSGCGTTAVNGEDFNVEFKVMNKDEKTAQFIIIGLPNQEEFNQIPEIIKNSLSSQELTDEIFVTISSDEKNGKVLEYGTMIFYNGNIISNNLFNQTEEAYADFVK